MSKKTLAQPNSAPKSTKVADPATRRGTPGDALRMYASGGYMGQSYSHARIGNDDIGALFAEEVHDTLEIIRQALRSAGNEGDEVFNRALDSTLYRLQGRARVTQDVLRGSIDGLDCDGNDEDDDAAEVLQ